MAPNYDMPPVRLLLPMHPRRSDFLYLGTEVGVFTSEDAGVTWSPTNEGPTNCAVYDLFWMNEILVCVTHGRGMFSIDLGKCVAKLVLVQELGWIGSAGRVV